MIAMKIIWDERKRLAKLDKHGLDFDDIDAEFFLNAVLRPAKLGRFMAVGLRRDVAIVVIFARLGREGISIISMRPAQKAERSLLNAKKT